MLMRFLFCLLYVDFISTMASIHFLGRGYMESQHIEEQLSLSDDESPIPEIKVTKRLSIVESVTTKINKQKPTQVIKKYNDFVTLGLLGARSRPDKIRISKQINID